MQVLVWKVQVHRGLRIWQGGKKQEGLQHITQQQEEHYAVKNVVSALDIEEDLATKDMKTLEVLNPSYSSAALERLAFINPIS